MVWRDSTDSVDVMVGATLIGGSCGTVSRHTAALHALIDSMCLMDVSQENRLPHPDVADREGKHIRFLET
jgi:hypothetical protein